MCLCRNRWFFIFNFLYCFENFLFWWKIVFVLYIKGYKFHPESMQSILQSKSKKKRRKCCFIPGTFPRFSLFKLFSDHNTFKNPTFILTNYFTVFLFVFIRKLKRKLIKLYLKVCNPLYKDKHWQIIWFKPGRLIFCYYLMEKSTKHQELEYKKKICRSL